jgi:hypothetical protein
MSKLWLLAPGHTGTSDAYRSGYERIWGKNGVKHSGNSMLRPCKCDSNRLEHFSKADCYVQGQE